MLAGDAEALPLADASVDVAHARWAYFFGAGCEPGLAEVARVLRPGGIAVVVDNDVTRSTFGAWFRRAYPAYDPVAVQRFWDRQGFTTEHLTIEWTFDRRDDLEAVARIELPPAAADEVLAAHERPRRRLRGGPALEAVRTPLGGVRTVPPGRPPDRRGGTMESRNQTATGRTTVSTSAGIDTASAAHRSRHRDDVRLLREAGHPGAAARARGQLGECLRHRGAPRRSRSDGPLDRAQLDAAIRYAGYEPGAAPWLSPDLSVWRTVLGATVAVAAVAVAISVLGPADLTSGLSDPSRGGLLLVLVLGLTAGISTCMAMVGGLVLGFSASHAAGLAARGETSLPFSTRMRPAARLQRRPDRRVSASSVRCSAPSARR